jgi:hypothetical protein
VGSFVDSGLLLSFTNIPVEAAAREVRRLLQAIRRLFRQVYEPGLTNPTTGIAGYCAPAASGPATGRAAAALPSSMMNRRSKTGTPAQTFEDLPGCDENDRGLTATDTKT